MGRSETVTYRPGTDIEQCLLLGRELRSILTLQAEAKAV